MKRILLALLALAMTMVAIPASAQVDNPLDLMMNQYQKENRLRVYQCADPDGRYFEMHHHPEHLRAVSLHLSQTETQQAEMAEAKRSNCRYMEAGRQTTWYGEKMLSQPVRIGDATWVVAQVTMSDPGATGYNFEGIVRFGMTPSRPTGTTTSSTAKANHQAVGSTGQAGIVDAAFFRLFNSRQMLGTAEDGGYLRCPSRAAIGEAFTVVRRVEPASRDEVMERELTKRGCVSGTKLATGIRVHANVESDGTHWYAGTASEGGRPIDAVIWFN